MSKQILDRGYGEHMDPQTCTTDIDKDDKLDADYEVSESSVESEDRDDSEVDDEVSESSVRSEDEHGSDSGDDIDVARNESYSDEESEDETSSSDVSDAGAEDDVHMEDERPCSAVGKSTGSGDHPNTVLEEGSIPKLNSQPGSSRIISSKGSDEVRSQMILAWKEVLESFGYPGNKTEVQVGNSAQDNDIPPLPERWTADSTERWIDIDTAKLTAALGHLHSSMSRVLHDFYPLGKGVRRTSGKTYWARTKARREVATEYLGTKAKFDKRVRECLEKIPHGSRTMKSITESAKLRVSRAVLDDLDGDEHTVALAKVEKLTKELLPPGSHIPKSSHPKISTLEIMYSPANFSECRAKHHATVDVASTLMESCEFQRRVKADTRIWKAKSAWLGTHTKETKAASSRSVASEILRTSSKRERRAVNGQLVQIFEENLENWKADNSRQFSDTQISQKFRRFRRDAIITIAAEHVSALNKYRAELPAAKNTEARRWQERRIAIKVIDDLHTTARKEALERVEALAVALTDRWIRKGPKSAFMDSTMPLNCAEGSGDTDSTSSEERDDDGEDATMEEDIEMPAAKRVKVTRSDARIVERSDLV